MEVSFSAEIALSRALEEGTPNKIVTSPSTFI